MPPMHRWQTLLIGFALGSGVVCSCGRPNASPSSPTAPQSPTANSPQSTTFQSPLTVYTDPASSEIMSIRTPSGDVGRFFRTKGSDGIATSITDIYVQSDPSSVQSQLHLTYDRSQRLSQASFANGVGAIFDWSSVPDAAYTFRSHTNPDGVTGILKGFTGTKTPVTGGLSTFQVRPRGGAGPLDTPSQACSAALTLENGSCIAAEGLFAACLLSVECGAALVLDGVVTGENPIEPFCGELENIGEDPTISCSILDKSDQPTPQAPPLIGPRPGTPTITKVAGSLVYPGADVVTVTGSKFASDMVITISGLDGRSHSYSADQITWEGTQQVSLTAAFDGVGVYQVKAVTAGIYASPAFLIFVAPDVSTPQPPTPTLPEKTTNPMPSNGDTGIALIPTLSWAGGSGSTSYDLYLGTSLPSSPVNIREAFYTPPQGLQPSTVYRWRVDARNDAGVTAGDVWTFTTGTASPPPPSPPCSYAISPTNLSVGSGGGTGSTAVSTGATCSWTATSDVSWVSVVSGASGTGDGQVVLSAAANAGGTRSGNLTIAGRTFTVSQDAAPASPPPPSPTPGPTTIFSSFAAGDTFQVIGGLLFTNVPSTRDNAIADAFTPTSTARLDKIEVAFANSFPADLIVSVMTSDPSGAPSTVLETLTVPNVPYPTPTAMVIQTATSSSQPILSAGVRYWLAFELFPRSSAGANGILDWNSVGYTGPISSSSNDGGSWSPPTVTPDAQAFRVTGTPVQ